MKKRFKNLSVALMLVIFFSLFCNNIWANNIKQKNNILSEKYSGKKLDRIKNSIKTNNNYRFLISSNDLLSDIKAFFISGDKKAKVKKVGRNKYMIKLSSKSQFFSDELSLIDNGILPSKIGPYDIIEPEIVELFNTDYVSGEEIDKLWGINKIGAQNFQEELSTKEKIKVGILDTGIDYNHTDLDNNYNSLLSYDFVNEDNNAMDDNGHGTQVAGIIGAEVNGTGVFGVNSNSDLVGLKVLDINGLGTTYDILEAVDYAKTNNIKVLNMSFGGVGTPENNAVCDAITDAKANGIFTIVSAGNSNTELVNTIPAACPDSITVGSINKDNTKSDFSNYGNLVDIYAPGVDIYTTTLNNNYTTQNGTSLSAPFITGLVTKELTYDNNINYDNLVLDLKNNYNLITNNELNIISNNTTSSGNTLSGTTILPIVDYSNYKYYSGTFLHNGEMYGNSLYNNSVDFSNSDLTNVDIFTYEEYLNLNIKNEGLFTSLTVPTNGLVGKWDLNGNTTDSSGYGNNGTASNVTWLSSSGSNHVADFDGVNSKIEIPDSSIFTVNDFTVSVWGYLDVLADNRFVYQYDPTSRDGIYIAGGTSKLNGVVFVSGVSILIFQDGLAESQKWYNLVLKRTGNLIEFYINGIKQTSTKILGGQIDSSDGWNIGQDFTGAKKLNGKVALFKQFNRSLSQSEIDSLYQEGQEKIFSPSNNTSTNLNEDPTNEVLLNTTLTHSFIDFNSNVNWSNKNVVSFDEIISKINESYAGDPITLSKGEFTYDNILMSIPGKKIPYEFEISYQNQTYYNGPVGINWDHNYNQYLKEEANGNVVFYNGKLGIFRFIKTCSTFGYNPGLRATLVNTAGVYTIKYDNGDILTFNNAIKKISKQEDRYGNNLTFTYTGGLLDKVTDTLGREIVYNYFSHNRLREVIDFNGRKVEFTYFTGATSSGSIYDLKTISINNGTGAVKNINFEYTTGGDNISNHNIKKLIDSKGQVYVENTYDIGDRVATQKFGDGTITYTYMLNGTNITKNTVINKLGNKAEYYYDSNHNKTLVKYYNEAQTSTLDYSYEYNTDGYIVKETKPRGNGYTYSYDTRGNLTEKRLKADVSLANNSNDIVTSYTYNSLNQLLTQTNPNGIVETNTINTNGNITTKNISGIKSYTGTTHNIVSNYTYNSNGLINTITDGEGNLTDLNYGSGQIIQIIKGTGSTTSTGSFSYNNYGNILKSTDGEGFIKTFNFNNFNLVSTGTTSEGIVTSYKYDLNNNKIKETKYLSGGITVNSYFYYDLLDNMTGSLVDIGNGTQLLTTYKYDNNNNIIEKKVGNGALYKYNYNEFGKIKEERIIIHSGDNSKDIVTTYNYDSNNNLVSKTDPKGNTTTYTYDFYDRLIKETNSKGTYSQFDYNKDGSISTKSIYNSLATILSKTDYFYDGLGNIVKEIKYLNPLNNTGAVENKFVYDNNLKQTKLIDSKGNTTTNVYDNLGRLDYSKDAFGNKIDYTYNKRDLIISKSIIPNTGTGTITTTNIYDDDSRLISETNDLNNTKYFVYNNLNQIVSKTDEENNVVNYNLDYLGNITKETKYISGGLDITTNYGYDEKGNLISVTDGELNETTYEYDPINRNTKVIYSDNNKLIYTYDKNNNLISQTDPNGTITTNTYDSTNFLISRDIITGTGVIGVTSESYIYDDLGKLVSGMDSELNDLDFEYDNLGRLKQETQNSGTGVNYEYDSNNNLTKIIHPDLRETIYNYDELNRNTTVSFSGETIATYSYTGILNTGINYGNGKTISFNYDDLLRLNSLNNGIKSYTYDYDKVNNIISDGFKNYTYDDIYRITQVNNRSSGTTLESFNYDEAGNRINDLNYNYTTNNLNQYTTLSGSTNINYTYDNNGNITNNGEYTFEYDYKNRLMKVSNSSGIVAEYSYDILGRRIEKKTENETIKYIYSDKNILEEIKNNGTRNIKKTYINGFGIDNLIALKQEEPDLSPQEQKELNFCNLRILPYENDFNIYSWTAITTRCNNLSLSGSVILENTYYFHKNHLGSIVGITDEQGNIVSEYDYDVFGKATLISGDDIGNDRLFTGREYDKEIGLYYLRARYYNPELGRFISRDPIGQIDDVNLYGYVKNNPVRYLDPTGLNSKSILGIIWGDLSTINGLPIEKLREIEKISDSFAVVRTTPFDPDSILPKVHTEIIFYNNDNPIASLGSTPFIGWELKTDKKRIEKYNNNGEIFGYKKADVSGCIEGLENSFSTKTIMLEGKATICWHGDFGCYNNAKNDNGKKSNIIIDEIGKFILPNVY